MLLTLFSCTQTLKRLDAYLDRELGPLEMRLVGAHLKLCHACEEKFAFERTFTSALRDRLEVVVSLEELSSRVAFALAQAHTDTEPDGAELPHHVLCSPELPTSTLPPSALPEVKHV